MIVDLCAGPGGWDEALRQLGRVDVVGLEWDSAACLTRRAAGHATVMGDLAALDPRRWAGEAEGIVASPPCPTFSAAGLRLGVRALQLLAEAVAGVLDGASPAATIEAVTDLLEPEFDDPAAPPSFDLPGVDSPHRAEARQVARSACLMLEPARYLAALQPEWIAGEQVPAGLPVWQAYVEALRERGWHAVAGLLNAADFGVPQTRQRAFLLAHRRRPVGLPEPTHAREPSGELQPWVTMAEALGWTGRVGFPRVDDLGTSEDGYRERDWRGADEPAFALTEKARSWTVNTGRDWKPGGSRADAQTFDAAEQPAPAFTAKAGGQWHLERPATTIQCDSRVWPPGHKVNADDRRRLPDADERYGDRAGSEALRVEVWEAGVLQSFPPDYPWQGTRSKQFEQVGNAVPPRLAARVLEQLLGAPGELVPQYPRRRRVATVPVGECLA